MVAVAVAVEAVGDLDGAERKPGEAYLAGKEPCYASTNQIVCL